jgi:hypothetical protein
MNARASWTQAVLPAVVVPAAIGSELAAEARARLEDVKYTRYPRIDRGSYDFIDDPPLTDVIEALRGIAEAVTDRMTTIGGVRALRLHPGDYLLTRHDRVHEDRPLELVLDLSAAPVPNAGVHWRHRGQVFFTMPPSPGALAIVERGPTVMSNHLYVSKRLTASAVRLVVLLRTG